MELSDELKKQIEELLKGGDADTFITKLSEACSDIQDMPHALETALAYISSCWVSKELSWVLQKLTIQEFASLVRSLHYHIFLGRAAQRVIDKEG